MKNYPIAAAFLLAFVAQFSQAATLQGRVVSVADGDTITVLSADKRQYKIRLAGIDAPEKKQAFGSRAKETLSRLVFDQPVTVEYSKRDRYGRIVGRVEVDGRDVNLEPLREGSAWVYLQYIRELPKTDQRLYLDAEERARNDSLGLWQDRQPEPPWEWRRERRSHSRAGG
jgi:endonuclease YncB( thermonuclease family)